MHRAEEALRQFGDLLPRLVPYLQVGDPPADAAVESLATVPRAERHALVQAALGSAQASLIPEGPAAPGMHVPPALTALASEARIVPAWVDFQRIDQAGALLRRAGVLGGLTLGLRSLVFGYAAPAGNKPLAFSGRLTERADQRLAETGRFVTAVCEPGGLVPGALGWQLCLEVRLMHAQVRRLLLQSGRWADEAWSLPINQHDMMATVLLFSKVFIDGLRMLGVHVSTQEADDYQHLWRWVGSLLGVAPDLLPASYQEATRLAEFVHLTQGRPDDDSRALVRALLEGPQRRVQQDAMRPHPQSPSDRRRQRLEQRLAATHVMVASALCRSLVGDELADALGLSSSRYRHLARGVKSSMRILETARRMSTRLDRAAQDLGARYWQASVARGLGGMPAVYALPERLAR